MSYEAKRAASRSDRGAVDRDEQILSVIRSLRDGEVVSYGDIAHDAGFPALSRRVAHLLASASEPLPWWRVVTSTGRLVPGAEAEQAQRLRAEGVLCSTDRVRSARYGRFSRRS